ncbi:MAG: TetR/AcrR family transcriptional regulator [Acidobacteriota bacterium]
MVGQASVQLSRKEREFLQHRGEIIHTAERVFSQKGYVSTTMEEIARQAEFAVGTLYKFFTNKADLHAEILRTKLNQMEQEGYEVIDTGKTPVEQIERYFNWRLEFFWENREFFRLLQESTGTVCDSRAGSSPDILHRYQRFLSRVEAIFDEGIRTHEFRPLGARILTLSLEGMLRAYLSHLERQSDPQRNEKEEKTLFEVFAQGGIR